MGFFRVLPIYVLACLAVFESGVVGYPDLRIDVGDGCWKNPCIPKELMGDNVIEKIKDDTDQMSTPEECQKKCQENDECNYFNHEILGNNGVCYLLKAECDMSPTFNEKMVSGPKDCKDQPFCEPLEFPTKDTPESVYWTCEMDEINPYKDQIPVGTKCHTRCGKDADANEIEYTAQCIADADGKTGKWELEDAAFDPLKKDDSICACPTFHIWYDPNKEDGAIFSCTRDISFEDPINVELEPEDRCVMICGYEVDRDIFCHNGQWNDVESDEYEASGSGIYCYDSPPPKEDE